MEAKIADRIARRVSVTKRKQGVIAAQGLVERLMAGYPKNSPQYRMVLERVKYWATRPASDTQ